MRMIPGPNGKMSTTAVQMREFSCSCKGCVTGGVCEDETQILNPWVIGHIILKNSLPVNPLPVAPVIDESEDDENWNFFEN